MRFSRLALAMACLLSSGCGLKVFDHAPAQAPIVVTGVETSCLSGIPAKVSGYLDGSHPASEVQALGSCLDQALDTFATKTRGANPGWYSSEELRAFLNRFFLADSPIPQGLFAEVMKVKQAVIGGEAGLFTEEELARTRSALKSLTAAVIALYPVHPDSVRAFGGTVATILEDSKRPYDLADAEALLRELEPWAKSEAVTSLHERFPWVKAAYVLLFPSVLDSAPQTIQAQDWRGLLDSAADAYEIHWHADRAEADPSWKHGAGREEWLDLSRHARQALQKITNRSPGKMLSYATINRALETVYPKHLELFGHTVSTASAESFLPAVLGKVFGPGRGRSEPGIDAALLDRVLAVVEDFASSEAFLEEKFAGHGLGRVGSAELFNGVLPDLAGIAARIPGSLDPRGQGDLVLPGSANQVPFGLGLSEYEDLLWREEIASLLIHGYAGLADDPQAVIPRSLRESELVQVYMDARPLGIELKYFDPADASAPHKRFRDASLFLFPSNGDARLDLAETTELIRYLISGKRLGDDAHRAIAKVCQTGPLDPYDFVTIDPNCYRREYYGHVATYWAGMPGLRKYYASLSRDDQAEYAKLLESVARKKTDPQAWFDSDDSEAIPTLVEYMETFFTKFDRNGDGQLTGQELEAVYQLVDDQLKRVTCVSNPYARRAVFNYLVRYGQPPDRTLVGTARFLALWGTEIFQYFSADRLQMLRILSELSKALSSSESCT
jgi:hypothetical protein